MVCGKCCNCRAGVFHVEHLARGFACMRYAKIAQTINGGGLRLRRGIWYTFGVVPFRGSILPRCLRRRGFLFFTKCTKGRKGRKEVRMDRRKVLRIVLRLLLGAVKRLLSLAWAGFSVWFAFWVARLTVPEFFYGRGREVVLTEDVAVMMVGMLLAVLLLVREK